MLYAVIMAGGSGTRLWPLSRKDRPKQALKLIGERTMFQHAVDRLAPIFPPERIFVVTSAPLAELLRPQALHIPRANFILEPSPRDSAPAAGLAAANLLAHDP
jgi:mannose-1-phosphate guanylyltransferase